ncbi:putative phospholipid metabolism enzyme regulator [Aspergillus steynii IBT 23096]|uniref:Putative phospholipid metabolism enzyme regulator n=1 Tax=Aspergillus steynii IBT 23096 TaxID=1392250 RepID=A0A2I2G2G3_9EURO|nr:putative phospholipid metabolism enzyme regulator [Aspergillus steynii IBT 23096]PLB47073.1 putative phospholipid metabolism enzyme regulator [Aspergillus steynii IBT 23096]
MAAESERSPYPNGRSGGSRVAQNDEAASTASRRSASGSDMKELPRSTFNPQTSATISSQLPKLSPGFSAPPSATNSNFSSRESSPVRSVHRPSNSTSKSRVSSRSRKGSQDRSPVRSNPTSQPTGSGALPSTTAVQKVLPKPIVFNPPPNVEPSADALSPEKPTMPLWAASRRPEQETHLANTSSKRSILLPADDPAAKPDRSAPRAVNRNNGPVSALETVQEMASDQSTPSTETILNQPPPEEPQLQIIDEDPTTPKGPKPNIESGSESGGNKSSEHVGESRRRASTGPRGSETIMPKRSTTSLSGARNKPADGSVRNMIVETETVSSIPQVSLGVVTGDRGSSGRVDTGTLRMKPSTETIRPKKEKKRARKPAALSSGAASSKADIFEAKVASAVDEADVSDSDETFVYESNPPDPYPVRQTRYHSRTPSATSMASQVDQLAGRSRAAGLRDGNHSVTGKRSMKFTNNAYAGSADGDAGEESGRSHSRVDASGSHTPRHHHIGRYGRNNIYPSLFDHESSPFIQPHGHVKSPRHFMGSGMRQTRHPSSRGAPNYRTISNSKKAGEIYAYDFDAEGADDERTPLVGSPRLARSRHGNRRPNSASLRQMEYLQQRQRNCFSRYGACVVIGLLLLAIIGGATSFIVAITKPLLDVQVLAIQNVLASEQEIMLDLNVQAVNPNLFPVAIDDVDINIFAKSRFVGTDKFWRDHGSDTSHFPRVGDSKKRSELARLVRCSGGGAADCVVNETQSNHPFMQSRDGVDKGTDPIPTDPAGDPQTMLLGRVFRFDSPLTFESSPWNHSPSISQGQIRLARPGNKTEEGGTERWERVLQHQFDLIVRGVVKYQLPLSSRLHSASVSSSVNVTPDSNGKEPDDGDNPNPSPGGNETVSISTTRLYRRDLPKPRRLDIRQSAIESVRARLGMTGRAFRA